MHHHTSLTSVVPAAAVYPGLVAGCLLAVISVVGCVGAINPGAVWARWFLGVYVVLIAILALVEFGGAGGLIAVTNRLTVYDNSKEFKDPTVRRFVNSTYYHCCSVTNGTNVTADALSVPGVHTSLPQLRGEEGSTHADPNARGCWVPAAAHVVTDKNCESESTFENALIAWLVENLLPIAGTAIGVGVLQIIVAVVAVIAIRRGVLEAKLQALDATDPWMDTGQFYSSLGAGGNNRAQSGLGGSKYFGGGGRSGIRDTDDDLGGGGIFDS